ncbi:uncharacterized protein LOC135388477 [Ornithodoros turicata]|uniref:uncharacterized protein LOC135388477 n=1 Tax=Ornithodoros turicata TaxID=34597 RepID=UPI0031397E09
MLIPSQGFIRSSRLLKNDTDSEIEAHTRSWLRHAKEQLLQTKAERTFSLTASIFTKVHSEVNDTTLDALCFLRRVSFIVQCDKHSASGSPRVWQLKSFTRVGTPEQLQVLCRSPLN